MPTAPTADEAVAPTLASVAIAAVDVSHELDLLLQVRLNASAVPSGALHGVEAGVSFLPDISPPILLLLLFLSSSSLLCTQAAKKGFDLLKKKADAIKTFLMKILRKILTVNVRCFYSLFICSSL